MNWHPLLSSQTRELMPFESRFGHAADEFQRYRPDYPPALYARIFAEIADDCRKCAMDLGAGTGLVAGHLASCFREVIAVEPDAAMAAKIAEQFPRVTVRTTTVEECAQQPETVDLVTIANALHWMDADRVFASARNWLRPNAALAVFDRPLPKTTAAIDAIVLAEWGGPWKSHRDPRLNRILSWQDQVRSARGFRVTLETKFPHIVSLSPAEYVGFWRSTSYGSAYARTLANPENYWSDLESRFAAAETVVFVDFSPTLILLRKV
jgi:SAM-dependent methyltransferase